MTIREKAYELGRLYGYEAGVRDGKSEEFWKLYKILDQDGISALIGYIHGKAGDFDI